ncbi:MAG: tRNA (N(6)-L-threonylcarbamoyladenosine(37)-C(2))-methylthiotransferase MtaB, partial [Fervidobacterium sp.]
SDDEFEETLDTVGNVLFSKVHAFRYSERPGTRASQMENKIPGNIKKERVEILIKHSEKIASEYRRKLVGNITTVLVEGTVNGIYVGYDEYYVQHETNGGIIGDFVKVTACSVTSEGVVSKVVEKRVSND